MWNKDIFIVHRSLSLVIIASLICPEHSMSWTFSRWWWWFNDDVMIMIMMMMISNNYIDRFEWKFISLKHKWMINYLPQIVMIKNMKIITMMVAMILNYINPQWLQDITIVYNRRMINTYFDSYNWKWGTHNHDLNRSCVS